MRAMKITGGLGRVRLLFGGIFCHKVTHLSNLPLDHPRGRPTTSSPIPRGWGTGRATPGWLFEEGLQKRRGAICEKEKKLPSLSLSLLIIRTEKSLWIG